MDLIKLIRNRISTEWKQTFNKNVDILTGYSKQQEQKIDATNKRIDNLVLKSGGDSPNEVVDARVNNAGKTFGSLQERLTAAEDKHDNDTTQISEIQTDQQKQLEQLNNAIGRIMGTYGARMDFYVSASNGDDKNGDGTQENPFKTIQMAVNMLPLISTAAITIWIEDGVYLEDVVLRSISANTITIRPINNISNLDPSNSDCPVKVRSIGFFYCSGYFQISGVQIVDTPNAAEHTGFKYSLLIEQGGYLAINKCKCIENTKSMTTSALYAGGNSKMSVYGKTTLINQNIAFHAKAMADMYFGEITGSGNNIGVRSDAATVRGNPASTFATTLTSIVSGGLIVTKGQVLS